MRYITSLLFLYLYTCSCTAIKIGREPAGSDPFVKLKDGKVINAKLVDQETGFGMNNIVVDENKFPSNDVAFFCDGLETFANTNNGGFVRLSSEGRINVYGILLQDSGSNDLYFFNYGNLNKMIPANTPAGLLMHDFKTARSRLKLVILGGLGCLIIGGGIAGNAFFKNQIKSREQTGFAMVFGWSAICLGGAIAFPINRRKMSKALAIHNGVLKPD